MTTNRSMVLAITLAAGLSFAGLAGAQSSGSSSRGFRPRSSSWVPQAAWNAIKDRAKADFQSTGAKLYKSGWTKSLSRGLKGNLGAYTDAYVVHAKPLGSRGAKNKTKGNYLAVKSSQGHYEVFPLALAANHQGQPAKGKHVTTVSTRNAENNTYAFADGFIPGSKVVQAVRAKQTRMAFPSEGQIVASKQIGSTKTFFLLGDPNRQGNDPAAYASVSLLKQAFTTRPPIRPLASASSSNSSARGSGQQGILPGGCVIPAPGASQMRTKFIDMAQPAVDPVPRPIPMASNQ